MNLTAKHIRMDFLFITMLFLASACTLSLAEDVSPPPGSELSLDEIKNTVLEFPQSAIDIDEGAKIFAQSCAPCHGLSGLGDGEQADQLPFQVPPIGDRAYAREHSLADWFLMISEGNIDRFMPPFSLTYSVHERWNVLAYVIALGVSQEASIGSVKTINVPEEFRSLTAIAALSGNEIFELIANNANDEDSVLSDIDIWEQVDRLQMLALGIESSAVIVSDQKNESSLTIPDNIGINGRIINASGGPIPADLEIVMHVVLDGHEADTQIVQSGPDGQFAVSNIELRNEHIYFFSLDFQGLQFFSTFYSAESLNDSQLIEIEIYESSRDISALEIEVINFVLDFPAEGVVQVIQQSVISNNGIKAAAPGEGGAPLINYPLPDAASQLVFEQGVSGERYIIQEHGFGDMRAILPGNNSYEMIFGYQMPYSNSLIIDVSLPFETHEIVILVPQGSVRPDSSFEYVGQQLVQSKIYETYTYASMPQIASPLSLTIKGLHPLEKSALQTLINNSSFLNGVIALAISTGLIWGWYRRFEATQKKKDINTSKKDLLDQIVALDVLREHGQISKRKYSKLRERKLDELSRKFEKNSQ